MEAMKEAILLLELAIARSRASGLADEQTKAHIREALEEAKQEIRRLEERSEHGARLGLVLGHRASEDGRRLPIENYDLSIEEMSQRLVGELGAAEVEQLKAYEKTAQKPRLLAEAVGSRPGLTVVTRRRKSG